MTTTTTRSSFLSRLMKAAWAIYRKGGMAFAQALKKAWALVKSNAPRLWSPEAGFYRIYVGEAYAQVSVKESTPRGYYQRHRACKGERSATAWVKAVGMSITEAIELALQFSGQMGQFTELTFKESKF
jgi:hypothetical protein